MIGKGSWFGGPHDPSDSGHTASGGTTAEPGIAVYNHKTLGGYWRVRAPNGKTTVLKQTDIGPAPWTGRGVDVTYSALPRLGYSEQNFPTGGQFNYEYLGRNPASAAGIATRKITPTPTELLSKGTEGHRTTVDKAGLEAAQQQAAGIRNIEGLFPGTRPGDVLLREALEKAGQEPTAAQFTSKSVVRTPTGTFYTPATEGYVHPIPGGKLGREDMGLDITAKPGTPIRAIGDSKVTGIYSNWYKGQPYVQLELLSGPRKGQTYYVAEQITPHVKAGDYIRGGHAIGHVSPTGTGLELGWGAGGGRTRAQATTGYKEGERTPAGRDFGNFIRGLK